MEGVDGLLIVRDILSHSMAVFPDIPSFLEPLTECVQEIATKQEDVIPAKQALAELS